MGGTPLMGDSAVFPRNTLADKVRELLSVLEALTREEKPAWPLPQRKPRTCSLWPNT